VVAIGVDEISYRRGQRYLTSVVDHHAGAIVWCPPGRNAQTLQAFFDLLGPQRVATISAVSIDISGGYEKAIREHAPVAEGCFDPFHVVRLAQRAVDQVRCDEWNAHERSHTKTGKWIKGTRWSLLKSPEKQTTGQLALLGEVQQANRPMFRAFLLKERNSACSTNSKTARSPRRTSTPGSPGPPDHGSTRSSNSRARSDATGRHPRRHQARTQQRAPRRPQQPHPPDQPPQLRIPLTRPPHRPRLPLLRPHHHRPTTTTIHHRINRSTALAWIVHGAGN